MNIIIDLTYRKKASIYLMIKMS